MISFIIIIIIVIIILRNKNTHIQGRGKGVLTQRHIIIPLKKYGNFQGRMGQVILHTTHSFKQCGTITHIWLFWGYNIFLSLVKNNC